MDRQSYRQGNNDDSGSDERANHSISPITMLLKDGIDSPRKPAVQARPRARLTAFITVASLLLVALVAINRCRPGSTFTQRRLLCQ